MDPRGGCSHLKLWAAERSVWIQGKLPKGTLGVCLHPCVPVPKWFCTLLYRTQSVHMCVLSHVRLFVTPWTVARQAPLSMGFPRQKYWRMLPFSSPGHFPNLGIEPMSPVLADSLPSKPPGKPTGQIARIFHRMCSPPSAAWVSQDATLERRTEPVIPMALGCVSKWLRFFLLRGHFSINF